MRLPIKIVRDRDPAFDTDQLHSKNPALEHATRNHGWIDPAQRRGEAVSA